MLEWLTQIIATASANIIFLSIFLAGLTFSVISIFFGGHGDTDHDAGDGDTDGDGDHDGDSGGELSMAVFSIRGISLLAVGFGGIGLVVNLQTGKVLFSTIIGLVVGYGFAILMLYLVRMLKSQQANSMINMEEAVGKNGMVVTAILNGGLGEVTLVVSGIEMTKTCVSKDGQSISSGTRVKIDAADGSTLVVSAIS